MTPQAPYEATDKEESSAQPVASQTEVPPSVTAEGDNTSTDTASKSAASKSAASKGATTTGNDSNFEAHHAPTTARTETRDPEDVSPFKRWLLEGYLKTPAGPGARSGHHPQHTWWQVMCLTGVDYFSTLGYQPGIAALAAGALSPIATLVLVLLTLFGALPIYGRVAHESPHGEGSIAMLEHLLSWWKGKLFVLTLLGFAATDFIITITLSAADATAHLLENPFAPAFLHGQTIPVTLALIALLGVVFLKGFKEAIGIAVGLVAVYLSLNAVVIGRGLWEVLHHPHAFADWQKLLLTSPGGGDPLRMAGAALILFPRLALGLSGFETGVAVMPLVKGEGHARGKNAHGKDAPKTHLASHSHSGDEHDADIPGRIKNTRRLLLVAALIMSVFLLTSSVVTTMLIDHADFKPGGKANGRALAYLAHNLFGDGFGTLYDVSTIFILWFAGASAMAGLLNIVPRYLPRYGMAPEWTRASRPLVLIYLAVAFLVTIIFKADVDKQGGAYATGVLVLMTSAAVAVTISARRAAGQKRGSPLAPFGFGFIALVFAYTTVANVIERPDGVKIAACFIASIIAVSLISRIWRTTELRVSQFEVDDMAQRFIDEAAQHSYELRILPNHPDEEGDEEYDREEKQAREDHEIPDEEPILFVEAYIGDASEFTGVLRIEGVEIGHHRVLRLYGTAIPNAVAALLIYLRDTTGKRPHAYFNWSEGNPLFHIIRYILSGKGDIAPVTREIIRQAEPERAKRPAIHAAM